MRQTTASVQRPEPIATPLYSALFLAFAVLCLLRVALNNRVLDLVMDYTSDGGSIVEKIHPTFWGFCAIAVLVLLNFRIDLSAWELRVTRAIIIVGVAASALLVFGSLSGNGSSLGYLLDTYVTLVAIIALFAFPPGWRRALGLLLLGYMVASSALGIIEYALRIRLMPYTEHEPVFRPTGLTNHPLEFGQWCTIALCCVANLNWRLGVRVGLCVLLLAASTLSGARVATVAGFLCAIIILTLRTGAGLAAPERARRRTIIVLALVLVVPVLLGGLLAAGVLARFAGDQPDGNAMSRIDVYGVLWMLSWRDLLLGGDIDRVRKLVMEQYSYDSIESSLLIFIVQFGLIGTTVLFTALVHLARTVARGAQLPILLAFVSFFIVALTNNSLSVKSSSIFLVVVLAIAFHEERRPIRSPPA